jgi:16S rRNA C967 or C1407 C5-methylase (RsmB/RsmF family)
MSFVSEKFNTFYHDIYQSRWEKLKTALLSPEHYQVSFEVEAEDTPIHNLKRHQPGQQPQRLENGLLKEYFLDPASLLVAQALPLEKAQRVLDMCAAPGGKSLALYAKLRNMSSSAELILNEISQPRRESLTKVIQNYIPRESRDRIWVKGMDGVRYGLQQPEGFDAILLDAPCSGEGHLMENNKEMEVWSPQRTKGLAIKQYSLLSSAWMALRPGGFILY